MRLNILLSSLWIFLHLGMTCEYFDEDDTLCSGPPNSPWADAYNSYRLSRLEQVRMVCYMSMSVLTFSELPQLQGTRIFRLE
jgi:hypothetical protein